MEKKQGIGFFERYLTIWVVLCIVIGIAVGQYIPAIPETLSKFEYANVSIPVAVAISLFGLQSGAALATVVGVLVEVPVMLMLVKIANNTRGWFPVNNNISSR